MADIGQAIQWLRDGQKIRREVWSEETYIFLDSAGDVKQNSYNAGMRNGRWETQVNLWASEGILAHDWKVYSQPRWKIGDTAYLPIRITEINRDAVCIMAMGRSMWVDKLTVLSTEEIKEQL